MSQPLTDQRPRAELIAELYDRHAAGLFAYCADQLGDLGSAADVLMSVLSGVPATEPPRAALYAFARRQIHRRDVVYAPPLVDPLMDPATALVERSLRELRPHQREVLVLCAVCGLSKAELAWVLDVAPDTADELAVGAGHRFRQALGAALASTGVRVPKPIADIYGALGVAPLRDVLGRLPWPQPPGALRIHFAGSRTASPAPLFVRPRWPSPPMWPQPLADSDPATSTLIFPKELLTPPAPSQVSHHEATTAPMPKVRDSLSPPPSLGRPLRDPLGALDSSRPFEERPFFMAAPADGPQPFATGDVLLPKDSPEPFATGDVLVPTETQPQPPFEAGDLLAPGGEAPPDLRPPAGESRRELRRPRPARRSKPSPAEDVLVHKGPARPLQTEPEDPVRDTAPLFKPRPKATEPVYRMPLPWEDEPAAEPKESLLAPRPVRARPVPKRRPDKPRPEKARRRGERHYDWAWELIGFLICVAIAMIVFFSVPMFVEP
ncbi:DNA-directed RNA polymerase specialized sigma24 family protein [Nonomuraea polychroma]|uniref:DNA-directed RNA polymerase specialized sigma24 family protein n=1 Tax=Nonomuraea polychroma TaxID=46176 RepID=A0A438MF58_9ACTN|nr:hypothetical protein [Nonomuraea polychroma]RVX44367.1 DNA-directed RNA polymerase specialized sigma24 family protein [Nonomuraea polychroma]